MIWYEHCDDWSENSTANNISDPINGKLENSYKGKIVILIAKILRHLKVSAQLKS